MILVRHGESEFNAVYAVTRKDPGIVDPAITENGRRQALAAADRLRARPPKRLICSPYTRALETAAVISGALDLPVAVDPLIGEHAVFTCDVGTMAADLRDRWPDFDFTGVTNQWWPDIAESEIDLIGRCAAFRARMAARDDWRQIAIVTHWGFIRGLTGLAVGNAELVAFDPS